MTQIETHRNRASLIAARALVALALVALALVALSGCAHSPFGGKRHPAGTGELPERVTIKTRTQTFNSRAYFALKDGKIWTKANEEVTGTHEEWHLFPPAGFPYRDPETRRKKKEPFQDPTEIVELSADADEISALSADGHFYFKRSDNRSLMGDNDWNDGWGFPKGILTPSEIFAQNRGWAIGRRNHDVLFHNDIDGNPHHYGTMGITTLYTLDKQGHDIFFNDSGLPTDFSHHMCGPRRGRYEAEAISVSASTMFVINRRGEMWTRLADFDTVGSDPMLFTYQYEREFRPNDKGEDYWTNNHPWSLPSEPWIRQPAIELKGFARISRDITILQNGHGNAARELRVAGYNAEGQPGYYTKALNAPAWEFKAADVPVDETRMLDPAEIALPGTPDVVPAQAPHDIAYTGEHKFGRIDPVKIELLDFNLECTPARLVFTHDGHQFSLLLHTVEAWTHMKRNDPGRDGTAKVLLGTLEIPPHTPLPDDVVLNKVLRKYLRPHDKDPFAFRIFATTDFVVVKSNYFWKSYEFAVMRNGSGFTSPDQALLVQQETTGFTYLANRPALVLPNIHELTHPNAPLLKETIEKNEQVLDAMRKMLKDEERHVRGLIIKADSFSVLNVILKITGLSLLPKLHTISRSGGDLLHAYADSGELLLFASKQDYENAQKILVDRLKLYRLKYHQIGSLP